MWYVFDVLFLTLHEIHICTKITHAHIFIDRLKNAGIFNNVHCLHTYTFYIILFWKIHVYDYILTSFYHILY